MYDWNNDVNDTLIGCMESTDFNILYDQNLSVDENVDVLTSYIQFCTDVIVPSKVVKCYGNNKPWVTKDLKVLLNKKKHLLSVGDREQLKIFQKDLDKAITDCKQRYKVKVEKMFKGDTGSAWKGIKELTGMCKSRYKPDIDDSKKFCNELNEFYCRFDKHDFSNERKEIVEEISSVSDLEPIIVSEEEVLKYLKTVKIGKAAGPDRIGANVLKMCRFSLAPVLSKIYQQSLDQLCIPKL